MFFTKKKEPIKKLTKKEKPIKKLAKYPATPVLLKESEKIKDHKSEELKFKSPKEVADYYRKEDAKVRIFVDEVERNKTQAYLSLARDKFMGLKLAKKNLDLLNDDLKSHLILLNRKAKSLAREQEKSKANRRRVKQFVQHMDSLESEMKEILDTKKMLIEKEKELVMQTKQLTNTAQQDFKVTSLISAKELEEFETSKEQVVAKARELLSEETSKMFSDEKLLAEIDKESQEKINSLNAKLAGVYKSRKQIFEKQQLLEISEKEAGADLEKQEEEIRELEEKYKALVKK